MNVQRTKGDGRIARVPLSRREILARRRAVPTAETLEGRHLLSGGLDANFSGDGKTAIAFDLGGNRSDSARGVAIQADGKFVIAGSVQRSTQDVDFAVARLNPDGSLDATFGGDGRMTVAFDLGGGDADRAYAVAIQADGKIVVVGEAQRSRPGDRDFAVARLNPDGSLDATFGGDGRMTVAFDLTGSLMDGATSVVIQPDGKIVVAGKAENSIIGGGNPTDFAVVRLNPDGTLDATFGTGGRVNTDFGQNSFDGIDAVAIQADGKIVVGGSTYDIQFDRNNMALLRYNADGRLDATFGTGGKVSAHTGGDSGEFINDLTIRPDGRIVAAARLSDNLAVVQFTTTGSLDRTFGMGGFRDYDRGLALGIELQPDGKAVIVGYLGEEETADSIVIRVNVDGSPDAAFGINGRSVTDFGPADGYLDVAIQGDGNILAIGSVDSGTNVDFIAARYLGEDAIVPIATPPAPVLVPSSDTGTRGDNATKTARPQFTGRVQAGLEVELREGTRILGTARAGADGSYAVTPAENLTVGAHTLSVRARDGSGRSSDPSPSLSLTILAAGISPTLIVSVHGQYVDGQKVGQLASALVSPLLFGGVLAYDVANGIPPSGSGRSRDAWQDDIGPQVFGLIRNSIGDQPAAVMSLEVEWDTYGAVAGPAEEVAARINAIVADTSYDGEAWDVLFVGFSRGGPFVNQLILDLDLPNNSRIDYSEAILLDPTASRPSGDNFPGSVPAGLDRMINYDDGYAFPVTQLSFKPFGVNVRFPLLTIDGNSGARIAGAEYRHVRSGVQAYVENLSGFDPADSREVHSSVPYWYLNNTPTGQVEADIAEFLAAKDHGAKGRPGSRLRDLGSEIITPASSAANFKDTVDEIVARLKRSIDSTLNEAKKLGGAIAKEAKRLAGQIAAGAKAQGDALVKAARSQGAAVLAEAKRQRSKLLKAAQAEVRKIEADAKKTADSLLRQGKLFGRNASKEIDKATKRLADVQKQSQKVVNQAQRQADQKVQAAKKAAAAVRARAEEAARQAAARLAEARRRAEEAAQQAAARVAEAAARATEAAQAEARRIADQAASAGANVADNFQKARKKFRL